MCVNLEEGYVFDECITEIGGFYQGYIMDYANLVSVTDSDNDGVLDTWVVASGATFYPVTITEDVGTLADVSVRNGQKVSFTHTITLPQISYGTYSAINFAEKLSVGRYIFIAKYDTKWYVFGKENGLRGVTEGTSGAASTDANGYTITLTGTKEKGLKKETTFSFPV